MYDSYPERQRDWPDEASATGKNPVPIPAKLRALKDKRMVQALLYPRTNPLLSKRRGFFSCVRNLQNSKVQYQSNRDIRQMVWRSQVFSS